MRKSRKDPTFDHVPQLREQNRRPRKTIDVRVSEINTQKYAAGTRPGGGGQGPAMDHK